MKYYVRTTGERTLDDSYSQIEYELLIDKEHKPIESFMKQLREISKEDCVLLEDDLILCKNFKEEIEKVISEHPNDIINFFTKPNDYFTSNYSQYFMFNQCTYYPKGVGERLGNRMFGIYSMFGNSGYDYIESMAIKELNLWVYNYRPCLVQHLDSYSLIIKSMALNSLRMTPYFKDYLDKYNIDYNKPNEVFNNLELLRNENEKEKQKLKNKE